LERIQEQASQAEEARAKLEAEAASLRATVEKASAEASELRQRLGGAISADDAAALRSEAEQERERAAAMQDRLDEELAKGLKSALAQQLVDAVRDAEEAREELRQVKRDLEKLRKSGPEEPHSWDEDAIRKAVSGMAADKRRNLVEVLAAARLITRKQLNDLTAEQKKAPDTNLVRLIHEKGLVDDESLARVLAVQCSVSFVEVSAEDINPQVADIIPGRIARKHVCVPIKVDGESITLAMANPMDLLAIEDIGHMSGRTVHPMVARFSDVENAVAKYYWEPE
jgi:hypothetical protein